MGWMILAGYVLVIFIMASVQMFKGGFAIINITTFTLFFAPVIVLALKILIRGF